MNVLGDPQKMSVGGGGLNYTTQGCSQHGEPAEDLRGLPFYLRLPPSLLSGPTEPSMPNVFEGTETKKIKSFPRDPLEFQNCHEVSLRSFIL